MPLVAPVSATATAPAFVLCYAGCLHVHSGMSGSNSNICMYVHAARWYWHPSTVRSAFSSLFNGIAVI